MKYRPPDTTGDDGNIKLYIILKNITIIIKI